MTVAGVMFATIYANEFSRLRERRLKAVGKVSMPAVLQVMENCEEEAATEAFRIAKSAIAKCTDIGVDDEDFHKWVREQE